MCLMKIDIKKACEIVKWGFIEETLIGLDFLSHFVQIIMMRVITVKFSIKLNGVGYGYFEGKGGLTQGDSISLHSLCW